MCSKCYWIVGIESYKSYGAMNKHSFQLLYCFRNHVPLGDSQTSSCLVVAICLSGLSISDINISYNTGAACYSKIPPYGIFCVFSNKQLISTDLIRHGPIRVHQFAWLSCQDVSVYSFCSIEEGNLGEETGFCNSRLPKKPPLIYSSW